jgi:hypothetical protein
LWFLKEREAVVKTRVPCSLDCAFAQEARKRREEREREFVPAEEKAETENGSSVVQRFKRVIEKQIQQEQQQWRIWRTCQTRICLRNF